MKKLIIPILLVIFMTACHNNKEEKIETPWGTTLGTDSSEESGNQTMGLDDIIKGGELIMLTISGPDTYYDYHGHGMGLEYLLCESFAKDIGVTVRVETCRDTTEMLQKLNNGDGDIIAYPLPLNLKQKALFCGMRDAKRAASWAVKQGNKTLAEALDNWFRPEMIEKMKNEENFLLSTRSIRRHVYAPMLNGSKGVISRYDRYFQMYAPVARMDWRLMAAQAYQESCFDPNAVSWAGAKGLMQIMPATARHLGLPEDQMTNPEASIAAAARYLAEMQQKFSDVPDPGQRMFFALACYNGGWSHIRDAMALARKHGQNCYNWGVVSQYILKLSSPTYYLDPVVKHGYMRGTETVDYVARIRQRWMQYCGAATGGFAPNPHTMMPSTGPGGSIPRRATKKYRFHV